MTESWFLATPTEEDPNTDLGSVCSAPLIVAGNNNNAFSVATQTNNLNFYMQIFTSAGLDTTKLKGLENADALTSQGYMMTANDWKNIEITAYIYVMTTSGTMTPPPQIRLIARGGRQGPQYSNGYEGRSYHAVLMLDGSDKIILQKELIYHSDEDYPSVPADTIGQFTSDPQTTNDNYSFIGRWIGVKFLVYNIEQNDNVRLEVWLDDNVSMTEGDPGNGWQKKIEWNDAGQWCYDFTQGLGLYLASDLNPCQKITWGSPLINIGWKNLGIVWFKNFSVREIAPISIQNATNAYPITLSENSLTTITSEATDETADDADPDTIIPTEPALIETIEAPDLGTEKAITERNPLQFPDKEIYPTKAGGDTWYMTPTSSILKDKRLRYYPRDGTLRNNTIFSNPRLDKFGNIVSYYPNFIDENFIGENFTTSEMSLATVDYNPVLDFVVTNRPYKATLAIASTSLASSPTKQLPKVITTNQIELAKQGFMFDENDFTNVEMTAYVNLVTDYNNEDGQISLVCRSGVSESNSLRNDRCSETGYKIQFFYHSNRVRIVKQLSSEKTTTLSSNSTSLSNVYSKSFLNKIPDLKNTWVGLKTVVFNYYDKNNTKSNIVIIEVYIDQYNNGQWTNILSVKDDGHFSRLARPTTVMNCGGHPAQIVVWGGPFVRFDFTSIQEFRIKKLSVREIQPPKVEDAESIVSNAIPLTAV